MTALKAAQFKISAGRPGGIRTPSIRFWRPALYQLELLACTSSKEHLVIVHHQTLFRLSVNCVMTATRTELFTLEALRRLLFVLGCGVISFLAVIALQRNDVAH